MHMRIIFPYIKNSYQVMLKSSTILQRRCEEPPLSEMLSVVVLKLSRNELTCRATFFLDVGVDQWTKGLRAGNVWGFNDVI